MNSSKKMKKYILSLVFLTLLVHDTNAAKHSVIKSAYFQFTQGDPSDTFYDVTAFTHITYAWANLDETFTPWPFVDDGGTMNSFVANLRLNANNNNSAVRGRVPVALLSVGGPASNATLFSVMAASRRSRRTFIRNSIAQARALGYDGLDLDWRSPTTTADMRHLGTLLKEWRAAVAAENATRPLILTATVHYSPKFAGNPAISYPVSAIVNYLDWVHLLSFEIYPWLYANATAHESPIHAGASSIYSVDYGVRRWISAGLPPSRAVLGLSDYSYSWFLKGTKPLQLGLGAPVSGSAYVYAYPTILQEAKKYNGSCVEDKVAIGAYCYYYMTPVKQTVWGSFDSIVSMDAKMQYLKSLGLRGFFFHRLLGRSSQLLSTALKAFKSKHL